MFFLFFSLSIELSKLYLNAKKMFGILGGGGLVTFGGQIQLVNDIMNGSNLLVLKQVVIFYLELVILEMNWPGLTIFDGKHTGVIFRMRI